VLATNAKPQAAEREGIPMTTTPHLIPLWVKIAYTAFMAVLIPIYLKNYGPTNFLYFCDIAAIMTLVAVWLESSLLLSAVLVGAFVPQMLWVIDFTFECCGGHLTRMTGYMFNADLPLFLRCLSFFHFWLVFLIVYLVWCVGYDKRGFFVWVGIACVLLAVCYFWMPPPSLSKDPVTKVPLRDPNQPVNINYVYNIAGDEEPQKWMDPNLYFAAYLAILVVGIYLPTHLLFWWLMPGPRHWTDATFSSSP
jgi:hypothetical protein